MWRYSDNLKSLYETPATGSASGNEAARIKRGHEAVRASGRPLLTEFESKKLLIAYGIPIVETHVARTVDEAVKLAHEIGYPVVLKLRSQTITHKTDVGGVHLNLTTTPSHFAERLFTALGRNVSKSHTIRSAPTLIGAGRR